MTNANKSKELEQLLEEITALIDQKLFPKRQKEIIKFLEKNYFEDKFYWLNKDKPENNYTDDKETLIKLIKGYLTNIFEDSVEELESLWMFQSESQAELYQLAQNKIGRFKSRYKSLLKTVTEAKELSNQIWKYTNDEKVDKAYYPLIAPQKIIKDTDLHKLEEVFETAIHWIIYSDCAEFFDIELLPNLEKGPHGLRSIRIGNSKDIWWKKYSKIYGKFFFKVGFNIKDCSNNIEKLLMLTGIDKVLNSKKNTNPFLLERIEQYKSIQRKIKENNLEPKKLKSNYIPSAGTIKSFLKENSSYKTDN